MALSCGGSCLSLWTCDAATHPGEGWDLESRRCGGGKSGGVRHVVDELGSNKGVLGLRRMFISELHLQMVEHPRLGVCGQRRRGSSSSPDHILVSLRNRFRIWPSSAQTAEA